MAKDSFADMFARGEVQIAKPRNLRNGDEAEGLVAYISTDAVFVDLDDSQQAFFERNELEPIDPITNEKRLTVKVGDRIKGFVVPTEGQIKLPRRFVQGEVFRRRVKRQVQQAHRKRDARRRWRKVAALSTSAIQPPRNTWVITFCRGLRTNTFPSSLRSRTFAPSTSRHIAATASDSRRCGVEVL